MQTPSPKAARLPMVSGLSGGERRHGCLCISPPQMGEWCREQEGALPWGPPMTKKEPSLSPRQELFQQAQPKDSLLPSPSEHFSQTLRT
jgi:hypothetical protein